MKLGCKVGCFYLKELLRVYSWGVVEFSIILGLDYSFVVFVFV